MRLARQRNVTQVVVGKPRQTGWRRALRRPSLVDQVIANSGDIDVYVVTGDEPEGRGASMLSLSPLMSRSPWQHYLWAALLIAGVTLLNALLTNRFPLISYLTVGLTELLVVLLIAARLGRGPALLAAALSAFSWNFLFIEPRFTLQISRAQDIVLFILYFAIALIAGNLAARLRSQERLARSHADRTTALYALAHETATAVDMDNVLRVAVAQIGAVFDAEAAILPAGGDTLARQPHPGGTLAVGDKEYSVAVWAFENRQAAGRFTDTLPLAAAHFVPLQTPDRTVGVLGIRPRNGARLSFEQGQLLETFAGQVALSIERELLDEAAERSAMHHESERLFTTLLNSISHELRTPIATITGAASSLLDPQMGDHAPTRTQLAADIHDAGNRLNRLVANLLDMSRLESGQLRLKLEWCDVGDVVGVAVEQLDHCLIGRPITIDQAAGVPLVRLDFVLMEQVFVNLLDNACAYTPPGSPIDIAIGRAGRSVVVSITDHGPGLSADDLDHVFDKFYRASNAATGGTGLGLSICRGLVEAHGGTLTAANAPGAGARFIVRLPADVTPPPVREAAL